MRSWTNRASHFLTAAIGLLTLALSARAISQDAAGAAVPTAPAEVVAELHAGLVAAAADSSRGVEARYAELEPLVDRTHDLPYIAELSIRRFWAGLTDEQRQRFVAAFSRLSVMTYAARYGTATATTFEISGSENDANSRVLVHAAIDRANDPDVSLDYLLHETDGGWKIINILADQVSDLALKRAEYARVLGSGTIDDLVAELESQTDELREDH
jgi:phospholipid transport system substrate-binding protein